MTKTAALEHQVALVTGAGSGLGAAISRRLAEDGATVVVNDLHADAAAVVAKEVDGEVAAFDVSDSAAFDAAVDATVERHGRLDILVNNAGIVTDRPDLLERAMASQLAALGGEEPQPIRSLSGLTDEQFDRMIKTHLYGTFYGTRAALRHMEPARRGCIVNLCSVYSFGGSVMTPDYAAAKHAIAGLTRSVGAEVAPFGIRVNGVAPGFIDTPLLDPMDAAKPILIARIPAGRMGHADEVAAAVRYLVVDATYSFGEILPVSGGWLA
jgi:NAD(P)-dependent dehydrogenase (short-subunit alcohol dehydrogenase family)